MHKSEASTILKAKRKKKNHQKDYKESKRKIKAQSRKWIKRKKRKGRWTDVGRREEGANWLSQALLGQCAELPDQK